MQSPDLSAHFFAGVARPPEATSLRVRVPTLVIWGMRDEALLPGSLDGLDEYVEDLKIVRIADAGHLPMRTHAGAVNLRDPGFFAAARVTAVGDRAGIGLRPPKCLQMTQAV